MKKISVILICIFLLTCVPVKADTGDVVGHIYSSDIVAYIDDVPIPSYNIGGTTCVSEWDLENYGFVDVWDANARQLKIVARAKHITVPLNSSVKKETPGKIVGDVYETDIHTYMNSYSVQAYNIGGQTMIPLEALANEPTTESGDTDLRTNNEIGYSNYGFKVVWNGKDRTIKAYVMRAGSTLETKYGTFEIAYQCLHYTRYNTYNRDLPLQTIGTYYMYDIYDNKTDAPYYSNTDVYVSLNDMLKTFGVEHTWENGVLTIKDPIVKKDLSLGCSMPDIGSKTSIIPIINIPLNINDQGTMVTKTNKAVVYKGEIYVCPYDWAYYLCVHQYD